MICSPFTISSLPKEDSNASPITHCSVHHDCRFNNLPLASPAFFPSSSPGSSPSHHPSCPPPLATSPKPSLLPQHRSSRSFIRSCPDYRLTPPWTEDVSLVSNDVATPWCAVGIATGIGAGAGTQKRMMPATW